MSHFSNFRQNFFDTLSALTSQIMNRPVLGFIVLGVISRLIPHLPNLTAMNAIALFGAYSQKNISTSFFAVLMAMLLSDAVIGFHGQMPFVYGALALVVCLGRWLNPQRVWRQLPWFVMGSSILFFLITNFGVWVNYDFYAKTVAGLVFCYAMALPFLATQILGDLGYTLAMFVGVALLKLLAQRFILPQVKPALANDIRE